MQLQRIWTPVSVCCSNGNTGQAVRASSSVPGVFEPVVIGKRRFVDGGLSSPVPVEAAREMGANVKVIAVDISSKASHSRPDGALSILDQTFTIMGQKLGAQELNPCRCRDSAKRLLALARQISNQKHQAMLEEAGGKGGGVAGDSAQVGGMARRWWAVSCSKLARNLGC